MVRLSWVLLAVLVLAIPGEAPAAVVSWVSPVDGDWNDPTKWSTGQVPGAGDDVKLVVNGTYSVLIDDPVVSAKSLEIGGTSGNQYADFDNAAGSFSGGIVIHARGGMALYQSDVTGSVTVEGSLDVQLSGAIHGGVSVAHGATLHVGSSYPGYLTVSGAITNHGTLLLTTGPLIGNSSVQWGSLTNASDGVLRNDPGSYYGPTPTSSVSGSISNQGSIVASYLSVLQLNGYGGIACSNAGTITIEGGMTVGGYRLTNFGTLSIGGRLTLQSASTLEQQSGTVSGTGSLVVNGSTLSGNVISLPPTVTLQNATVTGGTLTVSTPTTLTLNGGNKFQCTTQVAGSVLANGNESFPGLLSLLPGGWIDVSATVHTDGEILNQGLVMVRSTGTLTVGTVFRNQSNGVLMGVGTVDVTRGAFINEGFIRPGTLIGVLRIQGKLRQQPAGTIEFESQGETPGTSYDQLAVTDSAELDGTLKATFVLPASAGDRLSVLTAGACAGEFSTVRASGLADSLFPQPQYASGGVDLLVVAGVLGADEIAGRVGEPWLGRAYPSPARGEFAVDFELPAATSTRLTVHDVSGRAVATLLDAVASGGRHHSRWNGMVDGRPAPSGVYFVRMDVPGATRVRRVILTR